MKKSIFILLVIVFVTGLRNNVFAQNYIKQIDSIYSDILSEERSFYIHVPKDKSKTYPVLYLLDGRSNFDAVLAITKHLKRHGQIPEMIIIGIHNTNRTLDLTPSAMQVSRQGQPIPKGTNGGGENFTNFLKEELIPYIENTYPTTSHRTLIGHSLGGLFAINTLIHTPDLFNNYIAIDPSLWWDDAKLLKEAKSILANKKFKNQSLYVGIANTLRDDMTFDRVEKDTTNATSHIRAILDFTKTLTKETRNELRFNWKYYKNENHGSIPFAAEYDGLKSVFSWYNFNINDEFRKPIATPKYLINYIENHYTKASEYFGYTVKPKESFINQLGYRFLDPSSPDNMAKSFAFFDLNIKNYPKSANVYDSMADYYEKQNDLVSALKFASKAFEINKNTLYKTRVESLKKQIN